MKRTTEESRFPVSRWTVLVVAVMIIIAWMLFGGAGNSSAQVSAHPVTQAAAAPPVAPQATPGQDFEDVFPSNTFYSYLHNLKLADIVSGYACVPGGPTDPCVPPANLPYYHPSNSVTRIQMTKFIDLGRRNIADAIGHSLYISTTAGIAGDFETRSGGEAVYAECLQRDNNCYALEGYAPTGDYAAYMYGGKGVYAESDDAAQPGLDGNAYGSNSYGVAGESASYRGGYFKSDSNVLYSLFVDDVDGPTQGTAALNVRGTIRGEGNLVIGGSKAGYVVDIMQNVGSETLEPGDVVSIVGSDAPVLGQIPLVTVKRASSAYDTGVVGVVDQLWYAPDAATKAAYDKQEALLRSVNDQRSNAIAAARAQGKDAKPDFSGITLPDTNITDGQGTLHAIPGATQIAPNGYLSAVTLGSYKAVKVDASFGPIHAGDLLVSSPHAGYAMKATDKSQAFGATIGKALGNLETGTGLIPVMVTLK
jgi:hypothetical protein